MSVESIASEAVTLPVLTIAPAGIASAESFGFDVVPAPVPPTPPPPPPPEPPRGRGGGSPLRLPEKDVCDLNPADSDYWLYLLLCCWPKAIEHVPQAPTSIPAVPLSEVESTVERLRRLVALSGSDNVHEARSAADQVARMLRETKLVEALIEHLRAGGDGGKIDPAAACVLPLLTAAPADRTAAAVLAMARNALGKPSLLPAANYWRFFRLREPIDVAVTQKTHVDGRIVLTAIVVGGVAFAIGRMLK